MVSETLFTSESTEWETPDDLFNELNREFNFTLDPAATPENAKCKQYYTKELDGLKQPWPGRVFCNPPYGKDVGKWTAKAKVEAKKGSLVVMLLPARTDTKWFHRDIYKKAETRFIKGRLKFKKANSSAPFPSMLVIFRPRNIINRLIDRLRRINIEPIRC